MIKNYVKVPLYTTINEIKDKNYSLSSSQFKQLEINNKNTKYVRDFLDRDLKNEDNGTEIGSEGYVDTSDFYFIKTKALQDYIYLLDEARDCGEYIKPQLFEQMNLKEGDLIISKDSNVGEIAILDKDYPNAMLCGGLYKLPVTKNKYYLLAMIKSQIFRQQIDYLVPRGATIRHGKTKFLDCLIPIPNKNTKNTIKYVELLTKAIIDKEKKIREKHYQIMSLIQEELENNQKKIKFIYNNPSINEILELDRMDSALYTKKFKEREFLVHNYKNGYKTASELNFTISRGQNLQISNIGVSIQTEVKHEGFYTLILPNFISKYGTVDTIEYLGNSNKLKTLNKGDIIFGAEGNEKGRSLVILDEKENTITNIHGITLNQNSNDMQKSIFVKVFLDWYRANGMIDAYAVGGNGGSMAIKYWDYLKFPSFDDKKEKEITKLYSNRQINYDLSTVDLDSFEKYNCSFNEKAGINEIDASMKICQKLLDNAIENISDDVQIKCDFQLIKKD